MVIFDRAVVIAADMSQLSRAFGAHERATVKKFVLNIDIATGKTMDGWLHPDIE